VHGSGSDAKNDGMTGEAQPAYTPTPGQSSRGDVASWPGRMMAWLGRGRARRAAAAALYATLVEQARQPVFYAQWGVPDSRDGRLEMVSLHAILVMRRLRGEGAQGRALAQALLDHMFQDLDQHLREWGVGDPSVGKRMKELAQSFLGRAAALDPLLGGADPGALVGVLRRNVYSEATDPVPAAIGTLARYLGDQDRWLAGQEGRALLRGRVGFAPATKSA
jgi:cytochrome b pre-mRNA-processing protein 3